MHHIVMFLHNPYTHDVRVRREAQTLVAHGFRVSVVSWDRTGEFPAHEELEGVSVYRICLTAKYQLGLLQLPKISFQWMLAIWQAIRLQPDSLHAHDFMGLIPGVLTSLLLRKCLIYDAHEHFPSTLMQRGTRPVIWIADHIERLLMRRAHTVIAAGQRIKVALEKRGAQRVVVVGNWKQHTDFEFESESLSVKCRELTLENYRLLIGYLGLLSPARTIPQLIDAVRQTSEIGLVIAGYGPSTSLVEEASRQYSNIRFLGLIPSSEIPFYTQLVDVIYYCLAPDYPGGYFSAPNKLFEAIAAGKALLVTRGIGEVGEVVARYGCGITVDQPESKQLVQAFQHLLDPSQLSVMKKRSAHLYAGHFNWEKAQEQLLAVYENISKDRNGVTNL